HKPSTQANLRSHLRRYIIPLFGGLLVGDVRPEMVQRFISGIKMSPKTVRNVYVTFQLMWKSARAWQYVAHDASTELSFRKGGHRGGSFLRRTRSVESWQMPRSPIARSTGSPRSSGCAPAKSADSDWTTSISTVV